MSASPQIIRDLDNRSPIVSMSARCHPPRCPERYISCIVVAASRGLGTIFLLFSG